MRMINRLARIGFGNGRQRNGRRQFLPVLEILEDRSLPAVLTVNSAFDTAVAGDGLVTLREAITATNANSDGGDPDITAARAGAYNQGATPDTIAFAIMGAGPQIIRPATQLPIITDSVIIDGYTQQGAAPNTATDGGTNAVLLIVLDGSLTTLQGTSGLVVTAGNSTIRGLVIINFGLATSSGIRLTTGGNNRIEGNFLGTSETGLGAAGNWEGITVSNSPGNVIGGTTLASRNLISGNVLNGIAIVGNESEGTKIQGNLIGTNRSGAAALTIDATGNGILISLSSYRDILVGGTQVEARNVISGNGTHGIVITGVDHEGEFFDTPNKIQGNYIGLNAAGTAGIRNKRNGILVMAPDTLIGGETDNAGNVISGNGEAGVRIEGPDAHRTLLEGNYIGTDKTGNQAVGNGSIVGNTADGGGVLILNASENFIGKPLDIGTEGNLISGNEGDGVRVVSTGDWSGAALNEIVGNDIGTKVTGFEKLRNTGNGVTIQAAGLNHIGGASALTRNVISGNDGSGVALVNGARWNTVSGNFIGVQANGNDPLGNGQDGVFIDRSSYNTIGGATSGRRNVISANGLLAAEPSGNGVRIKGTEATGNDIEGNFIGTNANATAKVGNKRAGVSIEIASGNTIGGPTSAYRNIISGNDKDGVDLRGTSGNHVLRNIIGTEDTWVLDLGNGRYGINESSFENNDVKDNITDFNKLGFNLQGGIHIAGGHDNSATGNEIYLNVGNGIEVTGADAHANLLYANYIGTDATGAELPNLGDGVRIAGGAYDTRLGEPTDPTSGNIIRYNYGNGVTINDSTVNWLWYNTIMDQVQDGVAVTNSYLGAAYGQNNWLQANTIVNNVGVGVRLSDTAWNALFTNTIEGNASDGVRLEALARDNQIGTAYSGNVIWSNSGIGINVVSGYRNLLSANSIYINGGLGIDLGGNGVTENDYLDPDSGANELQNFPVITDATYDGIHLYVEGFLNSQPNSGYTIEWFYNDTPDPSGYGEGQQYLGSFPVWTDEYGKADFVGQFLPTGGATYLTMTATDAWGNTSEFSNWFYIVIPGGGNSPILLAAAGFGPEGGDDGDGDPPLFAGGGQIEAPALVPIGAEAAASALPAEELAQADLALIATLTVRRQPAVVLFDDPFAEFDRSQLV